MNCILQYYTQHRSLKIYDEIRKSKYMNLWSHNCWYSLLHVKEFEFKGKDKTRLFTILLLLCSAAIGVPNSSSCHTKRSMQPLLSPLMLSMLCSSFDCHIK